MVSRWRVVSGEHRDILGEGLVWSSRRNSVFWVDIIGQSLQELHLPTDAIRRWPLPQRVGWVMERESGGLLVGLKSGIAALSLEPFHIEHLCSPEPDRPQNRLNDAVVDPQGNLWFGTKDDSDQQASGALYRLDRDFQCTRQDDGYRVPNGPVFTLDGRQFWHADSLLRVIYTFEVGPDGGARDRREFLRFPEDWGLPDGMALDSEGHLWVAHWGVGRVSRFTPDGNLDRCLNLPTPLTTNVVFAGPQLSRMFVTSAQNNSSDPYAGALFEVDAGALGTPSMLFAG